MRNPAPAHACKPSGRRHACLRPLCAALLVGGCGVAGAETGAAADLHLSGFGTLGVVQANASAGAGFKRDLEQRATEPGTRGDIDTRLGVQANYRASSQFELVGQAVAANRTASVPNSALVTLAFVAWRPDDDLSVRVGRMSADFFLIADYRQVGFAYPFVRPPVETYGALPYQIDGLDVTRAWHFDDGVWKLRGIAGRSAIGTSASQTLFKLQPVYSLVVSRDDGNGLLVRGSFTRLWLRGDASAAQPLVNALQAIASLPAAGVAAEARDLAEGFDFDGLRVTYGSLGLSYDRGPWLASIEVSQSKGRGAGAYTAGWGLVGHRWGPVTAYGGWSGIRTAQGRTPPQWTAALTPLVGAAAAAQAQQLGIVAFGAAAASNASQRTQTVGMRWDVFDRFAVKLQWDRVRVDAYGGRLWSTDTPSAPIHANIGSATLDFVF